MSKYRKKKIQEGESSYERDVRFERIIEFSGWIFLVILLLFIGFWLIYDSVLDISFIDIEANAVTFSFIIFAGTSSAFSFALKTHIRNNRDKKKQLFYDWLIAEFLFCIFAILLVAAYQW